MCIGKFWYDGKVESLKKYFGTKHGDGHSFVPKMRPIITNS
jgi:hypothetical protein